MLSKIFGTWRTGSRISSYSLLMVVTGEQAAGCEKKLPSEEITYLVRQETQEYKEAFHVENKTKSCIKIEYSWTRICWYIYRSTINSIAYSIKHQLTRSNLANFPSIQLHCVQQKKRELPLRLKLV